MPLYDYVCTTCGHKQEHLQSKGSAILTTCPHCGADSYQRCLSAPAFVLKGSGWYASDFRNNHTPTPPASETNTTTTDTTTKTDDQSTKTTSTDSSSTKTTTSTAATNTPSTTP